MMPRLMIAFALGYSLVAAVHADDATKKDQEAIQGTWRIVEITERGEKIKPDKDSVVVFAGNKWQVRTGKEISKEGTFTLDATKTPKVIVMYRNDDKIPESGGIYSLEKDALKVCQSARKVPTEFTSTRENGCYLIILERQKK